jgi:transcriptional regulator of nitric oxide reductase
MIVRCNYEELQALAAGARLVVHADQVIDQPRGDAGDAGAVAAPSETEAAVEALLPRLTGDLSVATLREQRQLRLAVGTICAALHDSMESRFLDLHPADEHAVDLYFSYAHARTVLERVEHAGAEMEAMIEVMTGEPATEDAARDISFPD